MIYAIEKLTDCWDELMALAERQWAETEQYHRGQSFRPSFDRYRPYNEAGWFFMFTARHEGALAGYLGVYIVNSMHSQELIATEDTWFMTPEHRKGRNALGLFKFAEDECIRRGCVEISASVKLANPRAAKLLGYLGYDETGKVFTKQLLKEAA